MLPVLPTQTGKPLSWLALDACRSGRESEPCSVLSDCVSGSDPGAGTLLVTVRCRLCTQCKLSLLHTGKQLFSLTHQLKRETIQCETLALRWNHFSSTVSLHPNPNQPGLSLRYSVERVKCKEVENRLWICHCKNQLPGFSSQQTSCYWGKM